MITLRDIAVVLDDSAASEVRLDIAVALAQQHGAHLTGLSALELLMPTRPVVRPRSNPEVDTQPASQLLNWGVASPANYPEADKQAAERSEQIEAIFRERLRFSQLLGEWRGGRGKVSGGLGGQGGEGGLGIFGQGNP